MKTGIVIGLGVLLAAPIASAGEAGRLRLGLVLWLSGMLGAIVVTVTALPQFLGSLPLPAPVWVISLAGVAQSAVLLALAAWSGVALAPGVGLRAPAFEAAVTGRPVAPALGPQLLPGLIAGALGGLALAVATRHAPASLVEVQSRFSLPLLARVLYGGITEELLLRWGVMSALVWLAWRFIQRRNGAPRAGLVWSGIAVSAFLFAAGHLPAAAALVGALDAKIVTFVIGVNAAFGLLFGALYWRRGLESAMIAHAVAHVVNYAATGPWRI